jgi:PAS domain S-box-containing protein
VSTPLTAFLAEHEDEVLEAWSRAVQATTSHHYADRGIEELRAYAVEALGCVRSALRSSLPGPHEPAPSGSDPAACTPLRVIQPEAGVHVQMRAVRGSTSDVRAGQGEIVRYVSRLAAFRMRQGFTETETVTALLRGREVIGQLVVPHYEGDELVQVERALDDVFHRIVAAYGQTFCALCSQQMTEDRVRAERRLESVLEESADAIIFFDADRIVRSWNRGAALIFGYQPGEIIGLSIDLLVPEEILASGEIEKLMAALGAAGQARLAETQRIAKNGRRVWVDANFTTVRDPDGRPQGAWAVMRDLTERRRIQEANLQAERLALIGTMSAKLAHEIRNPIGSVSLNLDLLRDELQDIKAGRQSNSQESLGLLRSIENELGRVQRVIEDYLRFARLPSVRLRDLSLNHLLEEHVPFLTPAFEQQKIRLQLDLGEELPEMRADADQLWQALLNLLRNAIEAMPEGGTLTVSTRALNGNIVCRIRDTGQGMSAERIEKMWKPFWSTKRGGTGLGMPLAQQIVAEHGGSIDCESQEGKGTVFTLTLPLAPAVGAPAS